jgi:hypothetical protein
MATDLVGWVLRLRGVAGCLHRLSGDGVGDENEAIAILAMLAGTVDGVIPGMEEAEAIGVSAARGATKLARGGGDG